MTENKPKPLDLEELVIEILRKIKVRDKKRFIRYILKQRIKSACEFYLRYKDNPALLINEYKEYIDELIRKNLIKKNFAKQGLIIYNDKYNEWLFKLAFKGVLK